MIAGRSWLLLLCLGPPSAWPQARAPVAGPASLTGWSNLPARVSLVWPPVAGAERYRVSRSEKPGVEIIVDERATAAFTGEGADCATGSRRPGCRYQDPGAAPNDRRSVESGKIYTYRVWAIFGGSNVSLPSPPATVRVK